MKTFAKPSTTTAESRHAKIVCTLGPATDNSEVLAALLNAGMDIARLNFSHGSHSEHARRLRMLRKVSNECGRAVAVMQDLQGPKIRTGPLEGGRRAELQDSNSGTTTTRPVP